MIELHSRQDEGFLIHKTNELKVTWEDGHPVRTQPFADARAMLRKELGESR